MSNQPTETTTDWKSNRAIVAIIAGAAVFGFCEVYVVPIHTQALKNEMAANSESVARAKATEERASTLERQLKDALGRVKALEQPNLFSLGNPYPVGLGLVKIGQSVDDVEKAYVGAKIKKETRYWTLKDFHSVFTSVTYHFGEDSAAKKITFISFVPAGGRDNNFLINKLVEVLGPPTDAANPNNSSGWRIDNAKLGVYFDTQVVTSYMIMNLDFYSSWWPRKVAPTTGALPSTKSGR